MIVITALAFLACTTSATTINCKAKAFLTTAPACGPNLRKRIEQATCFATDEACPEAYQQLAELVMAPNAYTKGPGDVGHNGDDKLVANFKKAFAYAGEDKPELSAMLEGLRANGTTGEEFAAALFEEAQEVNHLSLQIFEMDGKAVDTRKKFAAPGSTHCPDLYHASRDAGYAIAQSLDLKELLGVNPDLCQVMVPGMPPFYQGDKTAGQEYFPVAPEAIAPADTGLCKFGLALAQGNQHNDGGLHVSVYNRRDAAGLVLTEQCYKVPSIVESNALVAKGDVYEFTIDSQRVKLVQGQARNDHNVGGACYIGIETDKKAIEYVHAIQRSVMPAGFKIDQSQQLHVSIAALGPKGIPHYKSPWALEQMRNMSDVERCAFRKAHYNTYVMLRKKMDVDHLTHWDKYEKAAAIITSPKDGGPRDESGKGLGINMAYLLVDVLGFKTSVVSPQIATTAQLNEDAPKNEDNKDVVLPRTMWNGNWVSEALRACDAFNYIPRSIRDWTQEYAPTSAAGEAHPNKYIDESAENSLRASVSAESYFEAVKASYAGTEESYTQQIYDSLMSTIPEHVRLGFADHAMMQWFNDFAAQFAAEPVVVETIVIFE